MKATTQKVQFRPPPSNENIDIIENRCQDFTDHYNEGRGDFADYLKDWHMRDALGRINDAVQTRTPEAAMVVITRELATLFEIAAQAHREGLEWEGVE